MHFPVDWLRREYNSHYEPGTWEIFEEWFKHSGHGDILSTPWLNDGASYIHNEVVGKVDWGSIRSASFHNLKDENVILRLRCCLEDSPVTIPKLFSRFVRSVVHAHLLGDFRKYPDFFFSSYTSARFILFDGAGTCLLLGAMFQSMAQRCCDEFVKLHYSFSPGRELTHVFGSWRGNFVDPDQKTFIPMEAIDQSALFGYLFQQLGVSAYQIYLGIPEDRRKFLFRKMTLDYFDFYDDSRAQYMYQSKQRISDIKAYFKLARDECSSDLDVFANDFPWKRHMFKKAKLCGISGPYLLAFQSEPIDIVIPSNGRFHIGLLNPNLPSEAGLLSAIFFGRIPGAIIYENINCKQVIPLPELPWMIAFDNRVNEINLNGMVLRPWLSTCKRFRLLGMGDLEICFDKLLLGSKSYTLVVSPCVGRVTVILPINAFAISSGQIHFDLNPNLALTTWVAL
jgi:hypothetical protein